MISVLFLTNYKPNTGGISGQVELLSDCLLKEGFRTTIFNSGSSLFRPFLIFKLLLIARNYDIIHSHGCSYFGGFYPIILGTLTGKILRRKVIVTYHGGAAKKFFNQYPMVIKFFLKLADHITVPSQFLSKIFVEHGLNTIILPNTLKIRNSKFRLRTRIKPLLIVTRKLEKIYNINCAIRAFELIKQKYQNSQLFIVGDGAEINNLKDQVSQMNIKDVYFKGRIKNDQIYNELDKADIFLNPTTEDNMPISVLEALACGLPVISTNVGGIKYLIQDKINGLLVDNNDHAAMADRVEQLIHDYFFAKELIINGSKVAYNYCWDNVRHNLYAIYGFKLS